MIFGEKCPAYSRVNDDATLDVDTITGNSVTTVTAHGLSVGQILYFSELDISGNNFGKALVTSIVDSDTFTIDTTDFDGASLGNIDNYRSILDSRLTLDIIDNDTLAHTSVVTGEKQIIHKGNYSNLVAETFLLKIDETYRDDVAKIYIADNGTEVYLKPHYDGEFIKNSSGTKVKFLLKVKFNYLSSINFKDMVTLSFESLEYTDVEKSVV